jgi:hypothetical protein
MDGLPMEMGVHAAHALLRHVCPALHCEGRVHGPHAPLMHAPVPHCALAVHAPHTPDTHAWPLAHCVLLVHALHTPETQTWPLVHWVLDVHATQAPDTHAWPFTHCAFIVQAPQTPSTQALPEAQSEVLEHATHTRFVQTPDWQSPRTLQALPSAHCGQAPPQSTSVSPEPTTPSVQESVEQTPRRQWRPVGQLMPRHDESTHTSFWQTKPTSHVEAPHARGRHLPPKHVESDGHCTPTHSFSVQAPFTHAWAAVHAVSGQARG